MATTIEARKDNTDLHEIRDVEIFTTGTHNGDPYTVEDLDEIVDNFGKVGFTPPLKKGHDDGQRAYGWVAGLRRAGAKLLATFKDVPKAVYDEIRERGWGSVSSEIYWNLDRGGQKFRRALKAVALLGGDIPAVAGLKPVYESLEAATFEAVRTYEHIPPIVARITLAQMEHLCAPCADKMRALKFTEIKVQSTDGGRTFVFPGGMPSEMAPPLCEQYGPPEGFVERCMAAMGGTPDAVTACAALQQMCHGAPPAQMRVKKEIERIVQNAVRQLSSNGTSRTSGGRTMATTIKSYLIRERDGQWCVLSEDESKVLGCHDSKEQAEAQLAAIEARKDNKDKTVDPSKVEALEQQLKTSNAEIAKLRDERRKERIDANVERIKLPAAKPFVRALYELMTVDEARTVKFSADGKDPKDATGEAVVDGLVAFLNNRADKLLGEFALHVKNGEGQYDDPADEADRRARKYMADKNEKDYNVAIKAVLDADEDLKKAYAGTR